MDQALIERLEKSFAQLAPRGEELVARFYAHLFATHPRLRRLFPIEMADQKRRLLDALASVVKNLRHSKRLRESLLELGQRHAGYGIQAEHYGIFSDALVGVMADLAGYHWSEQLTGDWTTAFDLVTSIMLQGQRMQEPALSAAPT